MRVSSDSLTNAAAINIIWADISHVFLSMQLKGKIYIFIGVKSPGKRNCCISWENAIKNAFSAGDQTY